MTRALIVTNPAAARTDEEDLLLARQRLQRAGLAVDIARTQGPGDAEGFARAAVAGGTDLIIAHGGDGTAMEVAGALVGTGCALGLLPAGTGNLLAGNLRIRRAWNAAVDVLLAGRERILDVGRLTTPQSVRYFAVAAGAGFDAELMSRTPAFEKRNFGMGAYVATAFGLATSITRAVLQVEMDGVPHEKHAAMLLVANCGELIPGLVQLRPDVAPDDGYFDVVVVDASSFPSAAQAAWGLLLGRGEGHPAISFHRAVEVRVNSEPELPVQADGESAGSTPFSAQMLPRALRVLAPVAA